MTEVETKEKKKLSKRLLPILVIFLGCVLPQLVLQLVRYREGNMIQRGLCYAFAILSVLYMIVMWGIWKK